MAEIVNLRLARKKKARAAHDAAAAANCALHGRTKSEKTAEKTARQRSEASLDGHRLGKPDTDGQQ